MLSNKLEVQTHATTGTIEDASTADRPMGLGVPSPGRRQPAYRNLSEAPEKEIKRAIHRIGFVREFVQAANPRGMLSHFACLHAVRAGIPPEQMPALATIRRWASRYAAHGIRGLIDAPRSRGLFPTVAPAAMAVIEEALVDGG
jgi:hypothetical protein